MEWTQQGCHPQAGDSKQGLGGQGAPSATPASQTCRYNQCYINARKSLSFTSISETETNFSCKDPDSCIAKLQLHVPEANSSSYHQDWMTLCKVDQQTAVAQSFRPLVQPFSLPPQSRVDRVFSLLVFLFIPEIKVSEKRGRLEMNTHLCILEFNPLICLNLLFDGV